MKTRKKIIFLILIASFMAFSTTYLFPFGNHWLKMVRTHSYIYGYSRPENLAFPGNHVSSPASAVPILMYHGVITEKKVLGGNTSRSQFISQMEMLKSEGYETISIEEYELFRQGKFILPAKPIIITFDDGRKDSFYPVDDVLKKLGFKATIFVATVKANQNEQFYLGWSELKKAKATGRWEIEAHGRRSHENIQIDENGNQSTYLTSRIYFPGQGLESEEDFKKRIEQDYIDGIDDIKKNLGEVSKYFAVPLSQYGRLESSNYSGAVDFNLETTRRYFKMAFVEISSNERMALESFYNYNDTDPYQLRRLEVKNRSAEDLRRSLVRFAPQKPNVAMHFPTDSRAVIEKSVLLYGSVDFSKNGITLKNNSKHPSARLLFGDWGWKNYDLEATVVIDKGQSVSLLAYYADENNYLSLNWGNESLFLTEYRKGREQEIASFYPMDFAGESIARISVNNSSASVTFNGREMFKNVPIGLLRGAGGFGVWDPEEAQATIRKLQISGNGEI